MISEDKIIFSLNVVSFLQHPIKGKVLYKIITGFQVLILCALSFKNNRNIERKTKGDGGGPFKYCRSFFPNKNKS